MVADALVDLSADERAMMRTVRHATRMPAKVFAHLAGCTVTALYSWEGGERRPTLAAYARWYWLIEDLARAMRTLLNDPRFTQAMPASAD